MPRVRIAPPVGHAIGIDIQADVRPDGPPAVPAAAAPPAGRRLRRAVIGTVLALGSLVGLGVALTDSPPPPRLFADPAGLKTPPLDPAAVLAPWADFPVRAQPRPTVVFSPVQYLPAMNASTRDNAFYGGLWDLQDTLPTAVEEQDGYPVLPARDAIAALRRTAAPDSVGGAQPATEPVAITDVRLIRRMFQTDRGRVSLPAWSITFARYLAAPAIVLAADGPGILRSPVDTEARGSATISPDGLRLTYAFLGAAPGKGNCRAEYTPLVQESPAAVALGAMEHPGGRGDASVCTLGSYQRTVSVQLTRPLGNRIVVTFAYGVPMTVVPDGRYRWYRP